ncbi:MAG: exodeoxyribonuclease III [Ottowia sp.]|nr:exodeoxyribonuclease III [Ottowia sp.]
MFKLTSLNLNGIRAAARKGLAPWLKKHAPDCICVQEIKAQQTDLAGKLDVLAGMRGHFHLAEKKGYSGVGIYTRHEPSAVIVGCGSSEFDAEGRFVELRFDTLARKRSIISCYFPSGTSGEVRQAAKYRFLDEIRPLLAQRRAERDFILCGDVNIAHHEIDLKNWKSNQKNSGFLPEERAWLTETLEQTGLVDVYRRLHPDATGDAYTWWSYRGRAWDNNVGWRIDYHLATPALAERARSASVYKAERFSDHAPLTVEYDFSL